MWVGLFLHLFALTHISSTMATSSALNGLVILFLLLAQASEAAEVPSPRAILEKGKHFKTIKKLVLASDLETPLIALLNTTTIGISLFPQTDNAFKHLLRGFVDKVTPLQQRALLLLHAMPKYYNYTGLLTIQNHVPTFAAGLLTVNSTVKSKEPFISTGIVTTGVKAALYSNFPLSIFCIEAVLIPPGLV